MGKVEPTKSETAKIGPTKSGSVMSESSILSNPPASKQVVDLEKSPPSTGMLFEMYHGKLAKKTEPNKTDKQKMCELMKKNLSKFRGVKDKAICKSPSKKSSILQGKARDNSPQARPRQDSTTDSNDSCSMVRRLARSSSKPKERKRLLRQRSG